MTRRTDRVNVLLRQELSRVVADELRDPRLASIVSVTHVETAPDLRHAKAFVSVLGGPPEKLNTLKALRSAAGFIRRNMRQNLALKEVPSFTFYLDESIERGAEVLEIINEVAPSTEAGQRA